MRDERGRQREVRQLAFLISGVERQVDESRAQAGEIERERLPALVDLNCDAVTGLAARIAECAGDAGGLAVEFIVMNDLPIRNEDAGLIGALQKMVAQEGIDAIMADEPGQGAASDIPAADNQ